MTNECPTPKKLTFRSAAAARRHRRDLCLPTGLKVRLYPYQCPGCGQWHLTRQTPAEQRAVAQRIAAQQKTTAPHPSTQHDMTGPKEPAR